MTARTYTTRILSDVESSSMTAIEVPFDPKPVFGKVRAPVVVKVGKHSYRSTICAMSGCWWIPLRKSNRDAAGVKGGQRVKITLTLDQAPRTVEAPPDLKRALKAAALWETWDSMSFTHKREYAEAVSGAKKPETRQRRIAACVAAMADRAKKAGAAAKRKPAKPRN